MDINKDLVAATATPLVLEAAELQADLRRAGIEAFAWVVNASLAAAGPRDPVRPPHSLAIIRRRAVGEERRRV